MLGHILFGMLALACLILGAELVIHAAKRISKRFGFSEFFIGLTLLSILTSLPEIVQHVVASLDILKGGPAATLAGVAIGANVGSNIIQITLITGIVGLFGKLICDDEFLRKDYIFMLFSIGLLFFFSYTGFFISRIEGLLLFGLYLVYLISLNRKEGGVVQKITKGHDSHLLKEGLIIAIGFMLLYFSAEHILRVAVFFSENFLIPGSLIGTLIVGVATALPELTTAITALINKSSGLSLGTLVGSNITNPLMALGLGAAISGYPVGLTILKFDIPFWFLISLVGLALFWRGKYLSKKEGVVLILGYGLYVFLRLRFFV